LPVDGSKRLREIVSLTFKLFQHVFNPVAMCFGCLQLALENLYAAGPKDQVSNGNIQLAQSGVFLRTPRLSGYLFVEGVNRRR
jgi:hypothetical protein